MGLSTCRDIIRTVVTVTTDITAAAAINVAGFLRLYLKLQRTIDELRRRAARLRSVLGPFRDSIAAKQIYKWAIIDARADMANYLPHSRLNRR